MLQYKVYVHKYVIVGAVSQKNKTCAREANAVPPTTSYVPGVSIQQLIPQR